MFRDEDFHRRKKDRPSFPNERQIRFFRTVSGPGYEPYPASGHVVYAELLRDTTFEKALGADIDPGTATGKFAFLGIPATDALPPEGTVVCAEQIGGRWWMILAGGGGSCDTIRFQIIGSPSLGVVEATVEAVPAGFTIADVAGFEVGMVLIYDPVGCFFNEPASQLTGRRGWAHYMQPTVAYGTDPTDPYNLPEWEVFSLCCNSVGCD